MVKEYKVKKKIVYKIYKGRDIRKYAANWGGWYIIYPYHPETNEPLTEIELKTTFPNALRLFKN